MKKIIIATLLLGTIATANAQSKDFKSVSPAEEAALNAQIGDPLVNGIPYSQFKAQCAAAKAKQDKINNDLIAEAKRQNELMKNMHAANGNAPAAATTPQAAPIVAVPAPQAVAVPAPAASKISREQEMINAGINPNAANSTPAENANLKKVLQSAKANPAALKTKIAATKAANAAKGKPADKN